ncbi:MAG: hypothetical protein ACI8UR_000543 [Natronomonas sp.]|jgi:hypothetical protein|uniref:hypothetical protein n=1 Tax=Natronomonas sp. TaxID=2184060 RepID=UPI003988D747
MSPTRRRVLAAAFATAAGTPVSGCLTTSGPSCPGATYRLSLSAVESVDDSLPLSPDELSTSANAVVETAIDDEHVETCVDWAEDSGNPGPSAGLREVGDRIESHIGVELAGRTEDVVTEARREGTPYRLVLRIESS